MRRYVAATGTLFGLLTLVHLWRMVLEPHFAWDPWYWGITIAAGALCVWAWRLLRPGKRS